MAVLDTSASLPGRDRAGEYRSEGWWTGRRLPKLYQRFVTSSPESLSVADSRGVSYSHRQLWDAASDYMSEFEAMGVGEGDVVVVFMPNWSVWKVLFLAIQRMGAIPATLPVTTDQETIAYLADLIGARLLIASRQFGSLPTGETAKAVALACGHALDVMLIDEAGEAQSIKSSCRVAPIKPEVPELDHIMFTSSTTGLPKAVMHTCDTLGAQHKLFSRRFGLGQDDPVFMASPLGHAVGAIHGVRMTLHNGSPLILQERWDPQQALHMVERFDCRFTAAATPFLMDLVEQPWRGDKPKLAAMTSFLCGGAQVPPQLMKKAIEQFPNTFLSVLWGMTEGGHTTCLPTDRGSEKTYKTAGIGIPCLEIRIQDETGNELAAGCQGEIAIRGASVFMGYLGQSDLYRELLSADGFFLTGDQGYLDRDGYLSVTGRIKDLIIRGGVNISPVKTEDVLSAHQDICAIALVGIPDERLGERLCAVIEPRADEIPSLADLINFAQERGLPKRMMPEFLRIIDEMPRTAAGKIRKNVIRDGLGELRVGDEG